MTTIHVDARLTDAERRERLYAGDIFALPQTPESLAFGAHTWQMICEAFDPIEPSDAQDVLSVEDFVERVAPLKTAFTHSAESKRLLREVLRAAGCNLATTYFDLPKLRIVTHSDYLTAGVGYAYSPHRDVWYSAPPAQVNWWVPVREITPECALTFHLEYWERPIQNSSDSFNPYQWNSVGRAEAAKHVKSDTRNHPRVTGQVPPLTDLRVVGAANALLAFSAAQLHSTVPNTSGRTRFSVDFRTIDLDDLTTRNGAKLIDSSCTGTTLRDFLNADDLSPLPDDIIAAYDTESEHEGDLVFAPTLPGPSPVTADSRSRVRA
jgi:hypothetical protein